MFYNGYNYCYGSTTLVSFSTTSTASSSSTTSESWWSRSTQDIIKDVISRAELVHQEEARWKEKDDAMDEYISQISVLGA